MSISLHALALVAFLPAIALASSAEAFPTTSEVDSASADWTVMVFMNAKNNLEEDGILNFLQMAQVGSSNRVNVLVEMGRPKKHFDRSYGGWSKTLRFRVTKNMTPTPAEALEDLGDTDMGSGASLAEFVDWSRTRFPARRYMLVIWDHGQGWRLKLSKSFELRSSVARGESASIPDDLGIAGGFRSISHDDDTGHVLYNRDIQDSLTRVLKDQKLDIISFDACLMAMIETAYAMQDVATTMIASEELEPGAGWDYSSWLPSLLAAPQSTGPELASIVVADYAKKYGDIHMTTLSAGDLSRVPALATAVSALADAAKAMLPGNAKVLKAARTSCYSYAGRVDKDTSVDLACLADAIKSKVVAPSVQEAASMVRTRIDAFIIANYASKRISEGFGSKGVAIYFPPTRKAFEEDKPDGPGYLRTNQVMPVAFVQKERWSDFLSAYWAIVDK